MQTAATGKKKNKKKNKVQDSNTPGINNYNKGRNIAVTNQVNGKQQTSVTKNRNQNNVNVQKHMQQQGSGQKQNDRVQSVPLNTNQLSQPAIIKVNGSMVTIRSPALQQAMASGNRYPPTPPFLNSRPEFQVNSDVSLKNGTNKVGKKVAVSPVVNGFSGLMKGKENVTSRVVNSDVSLRNSLASQTDYDDVSSLNGFQNSKQNVSNGHLDDTLNRPTNAVNSRTRSLQQLSSTNQVDVRKVPQNPNSFNYNQENSHQFASAARAVYQAQSAVREAMVVVGDKKKKKKKKGSGGPGHSDDWNLVGEFS